MQKYIEIMDTTLRDGEQTPGIAYTPVEKLQIAKILLDKLKVDRIEVASARVSEGEKEGAKNIIEWASTIGKANAVEILGFTDKGKSIDWIKSVGGTVINLLTKGSEKHCVKQLRKTPAEHYAQVCNDIDYATEQGIKVNVYLEDWSGGMQGNEQYVYDFMDELLKHKIERIMLADTLGIVNTYMLNDFVNKMVSKYPNVKFDFHGHNDYGLATGNTLTAIRAGVSGVHSAINGLGERAGNASLCEVVANIKDMTDFDIKVCEKQLVYASKIVQNASGKRIALNSPVVGVDVYTQTCGVHADGDKKGNLYANLLTPERFNRVRTYALGKLSGKASIDKNLELLGLELNDEDRNRVLQEVIRLGDKKERVTVEDLPFIIADILKTASLNTVIDFTEYEIITKKGEMPRAKVKLKYKDEVISSEAEGDGGYDAFMSAVRKGLDKKSVTLPKLLDYEVRIPPGGKTDALVETTITWKSETERPMITIGVDSDQLEAAIEATYKMLNQVLKDE